MHNLSYDGNNVLTGTSCTLLKQQYLFRMHVVARPGSQWVTINENDNDN